MARAAKDIDKKSSNDTSVLKRVAEILNLFSEDSATITLAEVGDVLGVSQATAYRYMSDLHDMGLLSRTSGRYAPGPKVMELEYLIRKFDPILAVSADLLNDVSAKVGCHILLGRMYENRLINVYYQRSERMQDLNFTPGRRMPIFRGSQARVVLAHLDRRKLRRIFDAGEGNRDRDKIGRNWDEFSAAMQQNRRDGYYISREELDAGIIGIAAPVFDENKEVLGSIVFAYSKDKPPRRSEARLIEDVKETAAELTHRIAELARR